MTVRVRIGTEPTLETLIAGVAPVDEDTRGAVLRRHDALAKPPGSLGTLEAVAAQLGAIAGQCPPPVPRTPWLLLAAGDHGVHAEGVNAWPQEVSAAIVGAVCQGRSVSAVLAAAAGIPMTVLDAGLAHDPGDQPHLVRHPVRTGTRNLHVEKAMTANEARSAIGVGAAVAEAMITDGADLLLLGEMGIANTTSSACLIAAATGAPAARVTGRGAGADDAVLARKVAIVRAAADRCQATAPLDILAALGGFEHAALVGAMLAAAARHVPVILDGVVTNAAALIAVALQPRLAGYLIASHRSVEPGAGVVLPMLGFEPLLDLHLGLGEGTGALLAAPLVTSAAAVLAGTSMMEDLWFNG